MTFDSTAGLDTVPRPTGVSILVASSPSLCVNWDKPRSVKGTQAQIIPVYAYDQRFPNVVYIRDNDSEKRNAYAQQMQGNGRPSEVYQFARFQGM